MSQFHKNQEEKTTTKIIVIKSFVRKQQMSKKIYKHNYKNKHKIYNQVPIKRKEIIN